jgi:hypothetical protein
MAASICVTSAEVALSTVTPETVVEATGAVVVDAIEVVELDDPSPTLTLVPELPQPATRTATPKIKPTTSRRLKDPLADGFMLTSEAPRSSTAQEYLAYLVLARLRRGAWLIFAGLT